MAVPSRTSGVRLAEIVGALPSGKRFESSFMLLFHLVDGKIVEHWSNSDTMRQLHQLGILPANTPA